MDVILQSPGFKASESLQSFVQEKVSKLDTYSGSIVRANVTLFQGPPSERENCFCEIRLEVPGSDLFVKKNCESYEMAVAETVHVLQNQLHKAKDRLADKRP